MSHVWASPARCHLENCDIKEDGEQQILASGTDSPLKSEFSDLTEHNLPILITNKHVFIPGFKLLENCGDQSSHRNAPAVYLSFN